MIPDTVMSHFPLMQHRCLNKHPKGVKLESRTPYFAIRRDAIFAKAVAHPPQRVQQGKRQRNTPTSPLQLAVNLSALRRSFQEHSNVCRHTV